MYEVYWELQEKPFENTPNPRFLFHTPASEELFTRLLHILQSSHGAAMLTGESGCGKTLVSRALLQELDPDKTEVALLTRPCRTPEEFLRELLYQLGEESREQERSQIVHRLHEVLYENFGAGKETVVLIDEAHLFSEPSLLEEIRLLLNFQLNDAFLITLLLVGQPSLAAHVGAHPSLAQRMATRGFLGPLSPDEVPRYVAHRLRVAGRCEPIFSPEALELAGEYAGGIPRKINNICDIALVIGFSRKLEFIDGDWMRHLIHSERGHGA